jgi:hypothetical protein
MGQTAWGQPRVGHHRQEWGQPPVGHHRQPPDHRKPPVG